MKKILGIFLLLCLAACDGDFNINDIAGNWQLQTIDAQSLSADVTVSLDIQADGKFSGKAPVNRYFGQIKIEGKTITTGPIGSTMMAGAPELMQLEQEYFKALGEHIKSAKVENGKLVIVAMDDKKLVFDKTE